MCGRYTLRANLSALVKLFGGVEFPDTTPRYNIAPTQQVLTVRQHEAEAPRAVWLRWGLIPSWAQDAKIGYSLINARADGVATKPSFRAAFRRRRCLVLADGYYEWQRQGKDKIPFHVRRPDGEPFAFAGLWEIWRNDEQTIESCTVITTEANERLRWLHDRMPVILPPVDHARWIDPAPGDPAIFMEMLQSAPDDLLEAVQVGTKVNNARNEGPDVFEEVG
jgi:putative SOS response-associated peptidase YedK